MLLHAAAELPRQRRLEDALPGWYFPLSVTTAACFAVARCAGSRVAARAAFEADIAQRTRGSGFAVRPPPMRFLWLIPVTLLASGETLEQLAQQNPERFEELKAKVPVAN